MRSRGQRVLIVDDYRDAAEMYALYLNLAGFETATAADGPEAIRLSQQKRPDLVLMDLGLPGMDGFEVTRSLKANPSTAGIPVVALTAHVNVAEAGVWRLHGFVGCLTKPCLPEDVVREVRRFLPARRRCRRSAPALAHG